jgi:hypothetical protein
MMMWTYVSAAIAILSAQPALAERCPPFDATFTMMADEYELQVKPYLDCLGAASGKKQYGNNDGPFAVSQCLGVKAAVLEAYPKDRRESISFLIEQVDREQVWGIWCDTVAGAPLPSNIEIRPDWPQGNSTRNNDAQD